MKDTEFESLNAEFKKIDKDGTGMITCAELKQFINNNT